MSGLKWVFIVSAIWFSHAALAKTPHKVIWFTTATVSQAEITEAKSAAGKAAFYYFKVDESNKIQTYFEQSFPKSLLSASQKEKEDYLVKNINPRIKSYMPEMMRSEMGASLAKMFRLTRIPAVVIDDKYVTYGLTVSESLKVFKGVSE